MRNQIERDPGGLCSRPRSGRYGHPEGRGVPQTSMPGGSGLAMPWRRCSGCDHSVASNDAQEGKLVTGQPLIPRWSLRPGRSWVAALVLAGVGLALAAPVLAHGVSQGDGSFLVTNAGRALVPFAYLGAKHMVTGYDHLLFLAGVVFFLYRLEDVALYVSLFALGHSITLVIGVLADLPANPYLIDAVIGLSVVYKGFDNLGGFETLGWRPDPRPAVLCFGLVHGLGLATKLQPLGLSPSGLVPNMLAFNVGVEIGQFLALSVILLVLGTWRASGRFGRDAYLANSALMVAGFVLAAFQLTGYFQAVTS